MQGAVPAADRRWGCHEQESNSCLQTEGQEEKNKTRKTTTKQRGNDRSTALVKLIKVFNSEVNTESDSDWKLTIISYRINIQQIN